MASGLIHILGASGSGTTTLGGALSRAYGYIQLDTDDYFWVRTDPMFTTIRPVEERTRLLRGDLERGGRFVVSGSLCGWGDFIIPLLTLVVFIYTQTDLRIERLKRREYERFGERIREGGDMCAEHLEFIEWAKTYDYAPKTGRSRAMHELWLENIKCPILRLDGAQPLERLLEAVKPYI